MFKEFALEESPTRQESKEFNQYLNVCVKLGANIKGPIIEHAIDRNFSNIFQDSNFSVNLYYVDLNNPGNFTLKTIYPPQFFEENNSLWEVCFYTPPFIFVTNKIGIINSLFIKICYLLVK